MPVDLGTLGLEPESADPEAPPSATLEPEQPTGPALIVSPTSPRVDERITVSGSGFDAGSVLVTIGDEVAGVTGANATGDFSLSAPVPQVDSGIQTVAVIADGDVVASAQIDVRPPAPSSSLLPILLLVAALSAVGWWLATRLAFFDVIFPWLGLATALFVVFATVWAGRATPVLLPSDRPNAR